MRALKYIRRSPMLHIRQATVHGGSGIILVENWFGSVVWGTDENGWEHVSVSPHRVEIVPSWDDMCKVKEIFWDDEEAVLQIHPPKSKYVNIKENCMHLWRPKGGIHGMNPEWDEVEDGNGESD